jgi:hypothetical protein
MTQYSNRLGRITLHEWDSHDLVVVKHASGVERSIPLNKGEGRETFQDLTRKMARKANGEEVEDDVQD